MKKLTGISLFVFFCVVSAILTAGLVLYQDNKNTKNVNNTESQTSNINTLNIKKGSSVTLSAQEVAKHNSNADCWMIVDGKVYNVSSYASSHPGGVNNILNSCGKDGSSAFDSIHNARGRSVLSTMYIGDLNQKIDSTVGAGKNTTTAPVSNINTGGGVLNEEDD